MEQSGRKYSNKQSEHTNTSWVVHQSSAQFHAFFVYKSILKLFLKFSFWQSDVMTRPNKSKIMEKTTNQFRDGKYFVF